MTSLDDKRADQQFRFMSRDDTALETRDVSSHEMTSRDDALFRLGLRDIALRNKGLSFRISRSANCFSSLHIVA